MVSTFSSPPTAHQPTPPRTLSPYISLLNQSYFTFWYDVRHGPYTQPLGFRVVHSASPHRWCFLPMLGMRPSHVFSPIIVFLIMSSKYIKLSGLIVHWCFCRPPSSCSGLDPWSKNTVMCRVIWSHRQAAFCYHRRNSYPVDVNDGGTRWQLKTKPSLQIPTHFSCHGFDRSSCNFIYEEQPHIRISCW